jgi:hypothetical protein
MEKWKLGICAAALFNLAGCGGSGDLVGTGGGSRSEAQVRLTEAQVTQIYAAARDLVGDCRESAFRSIGPCARAFLAAAKAGGAESLTVEFQWTHTQKDWDADEDVTTMFRASVFVEPLSSHALAPGNPKTFRVNKMTVQDLAFINRPPQPFGLFASPFTNADPLTTYGLGVWTVTVSISETGKVRFQSGDFEITIRRMPLLHDWQYRGKTAIGTSTAYAVVRNCDLEFVPQPFGWFAPEGSFNCEWAGKFGRGAVVASWVGGPVQWKSGGREFTASGDGTAYSSPPSPDCVDSPATASLSSNERVVATHGLPTSHFPTVGPGPYPRTGPYPPPARDPVSGCIEWGTVDPIDLN